jgi:hypothetical protein
LRIADFGLRIEKNLENPSKHLAVQAGDKSSLPGDASNGPFPICDRQFKLFQSEIRNPKSAIECCFTSGFVIILCAFRMQ